MHQASSGVSVASRLLAVAAFVGYIVQSNGIFFPWKLTGDVAFGDIAAAGGPPDQWDALPTPAKVQILLFIGARPANAASAAPPYGRRARCTRARRFRARRFRALLGASALASSRHVAIWTGAQQVSSRSAARARTSSSSRA
jgi:hypothetical protein